jgi:hypothetical protein
MHNTAAPLIKQGIFRIQYASNLSVPKYANLKSTLVPVAPYLALVGNCGSMQTLPFMFQYSSKEFEHVFYVPGPHDPPYSWLHQTAKTFSNVHLLQRESYYLEQYNLSIIGTSWWKDTGSWARRGYPITCNVRGSYDTQWIQSQVEMNVQQYRDTILLTHHSFPYQYHPSIHLHIYGDDTQRRVNHEDWLIKGVNPSKVSNAYLEVTVPTIETEERSERLI